MVLVVAVVTVTVGGFGSDGGAVAVLTCDIESTEYGLGWFVAYLKSKNEKVGFHIVLLKVRSRPRVKGVENTSLNRGGKEKSLKMEDASSEEND